MTSFGEKNFFLDRMESHYYALNANVIFCKLMYPAVAILEDTCQDLKEMNSIWVV